MPWETVCVPVEGLGLRLVNSSAMGLLDRGAARGSSLMTVSKKGETVADLCTHAAWGSSRSGRVVVGDGMTPEWEAPTGLSPLTLVLP